MTVIVIETLVKIYDMYILKKLNMKNVIMYSSVEKDFLGMNENEHITFFDYNDKFNEYFNKIVESYNNDVIIIGRNVNIMNECINIFIMYDVKSLIDDVKNHNEVIMKNMDKINDIIMNDNISTINRKIKNEYLDIHEDDVKKLYSLYKIRCKYTKGYMIELNDVANIKIEKLIRNMSLQQCKKIFAIIIQKKSKAVDIIINKFKK